MTSGSSADGGLGVSLFMVVSICYLHFIVFLICLVMCFSLVFILFILTNNLIIKVMAFQEN